VRYFLDSYLKAYLASLINLGVNEVAAALNAVSPDLAQTFLGAKYKSGKDYEKNEFRVDSWDTVSTRLQPGCTHF
jgi:hypothetical protein